MNLVILAAQIEHRRPASRLRKHRARAEDSVGQRVALSKRLVKRFIEFDGVLIQDGKLHSYDRWDASQDQPWSHAAQ